MAMSVDKTFKLRGSNGQTVNLMEWQYWDGTTATTLARIASSGQFLAPSIVGTNFQITSSGIFSNGTTSAPANIQSYFLTTSATNVGQVIRGAVSQSADLLVGQNNAGSNLFSVSSAGALYTGSTLFTTAQTYIYGAGDYGAALNVQTRATGSQGLIVRGRTGQSVNLQEWQTDTPTTVASVSQTGVITTTGLTLSSTTSPITLNASVGTSGQVLSSAGAGATPTWRDGPVDGTTTTATIGFGFMGLPQNATTTGSYTIVAADAGKHIYASANRTVTINSNTNLALPIGTTLTFIAGSGATMTIAITSDTMYLAGPGTTGSRTLAPFGMATAVKLTSTTWMISGNGLT